MGVREAHDGGIAVLVARRPFVGVLEIRHGGVRRELDHAERYRRTGKEMAIPARTYARIDVRGMLIGGVDRCGSEHAQRCDHQGGTKQEYIGRRVMGFGGINEFGSF